MPAFHRNNLKSEVPASRATLSGIFAIAIWSTMIAVSRELSEKMGALFLAEIIFLGAGTLGVSIFLIRNSFLGRSHCFPVKYLLACGGLFVAYELALYYALGYAAGRQQALEVGLINYLWIPFTLLFSVPVLKKRAGPLLGLGIAVALFGVALAILPPGYSWSQFQLSFARNRSVYFAALAAALAWGLYSNLSRKLAPQGAGSGATPFFLLATGLVLISLRILAGEAPAWPVSWDWMRLLYLAIFPTLLGYGFWDLAVRRGNIILVTALSYFIPVTSTLITSFYLAIPLSANIWLALLLVMGGAFLCRVSIRDR